MNHRYPWRILRPVVWVIQLASLGLRAEEHSISNVLSGTNLSGYVDTVAIWQWGSIPAIPGADSFADRSPLTNQLQRLIYSFAGAGSEPGEPGGVAGAAGRTRWWSWTAPERGTMTLLAVPTNAPLALAVYVGDSLAQLRRITNNSVATSRQCPGLPVEAGRRLEVSVGWEVEAGQTYQVALDYADPGSVPLASATPSTPTAGLVLNSWAVFNRVPEHNLFAGRQLLTGKSIVVDNATIGARPQSGEPAVVAGVQKSLWYRWVAPESGLAVFSTKPVAQPASPQTTTVLSQLAPVRYDWPDGIENGRELWLQPANYTANVEGLWGGVSSSASTDTTSGSVSTMSGGSWGIEVLAGCEPWRDVNPAVPFQPVLAVYTGGALAELRSLGHGDEVSFRAEAGREYVLQFAADSRTDGYAASYLELIRPPNDSLTNRIEITGAVAVGSGTIIGAAQGKSDPGDPLRGSVWWTWVAPEAGIVRLNLSSTGFSPRTLVLAGTNLSRLAHVTNGHRLTEWTVQAGESYQLGIGSADDLEGTYSFDLSLKRFEPGFAPAGVKPLADGSFRLELNHLYGRQIELQVSGDLLTWQKHWAGRFNADQAVIRDFYTSPAPRLYRVKRVDGE